MHADQNQRTLGRVALIGRKVRRALGDRTLGRKLRRKVENAFYVPAAAAVQSRRLSKADQQIDLSDGFADHRGTPCERRCSDAALLRLVDAYAATEMDRPRSCPAELSVRGVWSEWLDMYYSHLRQLLRSGDVPGLRRLLENLHRDPTVIGVGGTLDDLGKAPRPLTAAYYRSMWCRYRDLLADIRPDWQDVHTPVVGNPHGVRLDDRLVAVETLRHAYYATKVLNHIDHPTVELLEIGGGLGGQAYQFLHLGGARVSRYTIVDLPEVACLAGYCLMAALGEDCVRLFGEATNGELQRIEVLPHWSIRTIPARSATLAFNAYSFSEMDGASSSYYLHAIERIADGYFFHINHETRFRYATDDDGLATSVNRIGSELVPDEDAFQLVGRWTAPFVRLENRHNKAFEYLYERR